MANRQMAHDIGLNNTIILCELVKQFIYYKKLGQTVSYDGLDGWFYETIDHMQKWTTLTGREQEPCIKKLKELGYIQQIVKGIPAKRYFRIDQIKLLEYFSKEDSSFDILSKLGSTAGEDLHSPNVKTSPYMYKEKREEKRIKDTAPNVAQPSTEPFISHGSKVKLKATEYEKLIQDNTKQKVDDTICQINDYEDAHGKKGYKCYAAAIRQWLRREIHTSAPRQTQKYPPKKEDWPKINRLKAEDWKKKNPDKLKHVEIEHYYATNKIKRNLTIDFRLIDPDDFVSQFQRIAETYDFVQ
jgi:hypothetical protein